MKFLNLLKRSYAFRVWVVTSVVCWLLGGIFTIWAVCGTALVAFVTYHSEA